MAAIPGNVKVIVTTVQMQGTIYRTIDTEADVVIYSLSTPNGTAIAAVPISQTSLAQPEPK